MDLSIHVQAGGMSTAFALCHWAAIVSREPGKSTSQGLGAGQGLDVLPHQITAMAHVTSILQMLGRPWAHWAGIDCPEWGVNGVKIAKGGSTLW